MIQLRTFQPEDAEKIISWVDSPLVFYQWCAGFLGTYPITAENLRQYYEKEGTDADYHVLTAFHEQGIFAHLRGRTGNGKNRLSHSGYKPARSGLWQKADAGNFETCLFL